MKVGDIVKHRGERGIIRWSAADEDAFATIPDYVERMYEPLTVSELFAAAGFPVPEGAKIRCKAPGLWRAWTNDRTVVWEFSNDYSGNAAVWEWHEYKTVRDFNEFTFPDLSRLPASDAFDCLPQIVRQVVEGE